MRAVLFIAFFIPVGALAVSFVIWKLTAPSRRKRRIQELENANRNLDSLMDRIRENKEA